MFIFDLPPFHVGFHLQEVFETNTPRTSGCSLQHESTEFGVEVRGIFAITGGCQNDSPNFQGVSRSIPLTGPRCRPARYPQPSRGPRPGQGISESQPEPKITVPFLSHRRGPPRGIRPKLLRGETISVYRYEAGGIIGSNARTSSPHRRASRSLPLARRQLASNCCIDLLALFPTPIG